MYARKQIEINQLKNEYESAVTNTFEKWKLDFYLDYDNNPNKNECLKERLSFFINVIFDKYFDLDKGFGWLQDEPLKRKHFYKHLMVIRKNSEINYSFLNRIIDGKNVDPKCDNIPEILAGAAWKFYCWLEELTLLDTNNIQSKIKDKEINDLPILTSTNKTKFSILEIAFYYHFNKSKYDTTNISYRAFSYDTTASYLKKKHLELEKKLHEIDTTILTDRNKAASCKLFEKMLPYIKVDYQEEPRKILLKLKKVF